MALPRPRARARLASREAVEVSEQTKLFDFPDYDPDQSQWFTSTELAERIVAEWSDLFRGRWSLEPTAGRGDLVQAVAPLARFVLAVERDPKWADECRRLVSQRVADPNRVRVWTGDFFDFARETGLARMCDLALQNTPFEDFLDVRFLEVVLELLGEAVAVLRLESLATIERFERVWGRAHLRRLAILPRRPAFSGQRGALSDFCFAYVSTEEGPQSIEWWLI